MLIDKTISQIEAQSEKIRKQAITHLEKLTMPYWAMGKLMDLSVDLAGITNSLNPSLKRKGIVVMASDHGVTEEGVSNYPSEVTIQMVHNFVNGGATINALASLSNAKVIVVDMGINGDMSNLVNNNKIISKKINTGTKNFLKEPAMTRDEAIKSIEAGIDIVNKFKDEIDVFGLGEMGIGNTTPSAAIASYITKKNVRDIAGAGTGIDEDKWNNKVNVIEKAIRIHTPNIKDPIDILRTLGGFEIGGLLGVILGAASLKKPVIIDGFITTASAILAKEICKESVDYMIASHRSEEKGHLLMLNYLNLSPLLNLNLRLGEGTGGALAMNLVDASINILTKVATFEDANVSKAI